MLAMFGIAMALGTAIMTWKMVITGDDARERDLQHQIKLVVGPSSGPWGEHTAPLDWCETNYAVTGQMAEFWNTTTCAAFVLFALLAGADAWTGKPPPNGGRAPAVYYFFCVALALTGVSSAVFHGTLWWWGQKLDEMSECATLIALVHMRRERSMLWTLAHTAIACLGTVFVEQVFTELNVVFLVWCLLCTMVQISRKHQSLQRHVMRAAVLALVGFAFWLVDKVGCSSHPFALQWFQLHAWWHLFTAGALFQCAVVGLCTFRLDRGCTLSPRPRCQTGVLWDTADYID